MSQMTMVFLIGVPERECAGRQMGQALSRLNAECPPRTRKERDSTWTSCGSRNHMHCVVFKALLYGKSAQVSLLGHFIPFVASWQGASQCRRFVCRLQEYLLICGVRHRFYKIASQSLRLSCDKRWYPLLAAQITIRCKQIAPRDS